MTADAVCAYYRNDKDEYGNPVQRFSLAKEVYDQDWEHGNSMTYNPVKDYIYVALYTSLNPELRGCIYVMDPHTLSLLGTIKISDSYNILSIAYDRVNDRYYAQADETGGFRIIVLDADFQIIEDFGPTDPAPGYNFQPFCLYGDYLIQAPLTQEWNIGEYLMAYSIPSRMYADCVRYLPPDEGAEKTETESIARLDENSFLTVVNQTYSDGTGHASIYRMTFPNLPDADPVSSPAVPPETDPEVTIVTGTETMASVTPSADGEEEPDTGSAVNLLPVILAIALAVAGIFLIRLWQIRILRERHRREARMKREHKLLMDQIEREINKTRL